MAVTFMLGGSSAYEFNGGAYDDSGSVEWTDAQGTNGAALYTATGCTVIDSGGYATILKTGAFAAGLDDIYVYCEFDTEFVFTSGRYKITSSTSDNLVLDLAIEVGYAGVTVNTARVGGSVSEGSSGDAENIEAIMQMAVAGDTIKLQGDIGTDRKLTLTTDGTVASRITFEGVDTTTGNRLGLDDTLPMIKAGAVIDEILNGSGNYWDIAAIEFDGDSKAVDALQWAYGALSCRLTNIKCHNAQVGLRWESTMSLIVNCDCYDNLIGVVATSYDQRFVNCRMRDNTIGGFLEYAHSSMIIGCLITGNGGYGLKIDVDTTHRMVIMNCTIADNAGDGIVIKDCVDWVILNNIISGHNNSGKYGIKWDTSGYESQQLLIDHNNAYDNGAGGSDHTSEGTWATLGGGENLTLDPALDANYRPTNTRLLYSGKLDAEGNPAHIGAVFPARHYVAAPATLVGSLIGGF